MAVDLSHDQQAFVNRAMECRETPAGCDIVACNGCSGSGKSTTIVELCRRMSVSVHQPPLSLSLLSYSNDAVKVLTKKASQRGLVDSS